MMLQYSLNQDDCFISFLSTFPRGRTYSSLAVMHAGGKNAIMDRFDPEEALQLIEKEKGTIFFNFAPILGMILDKYEEGSYKYFQY